MADTGQISHLPTVSLTNGTDMFNILLHFQSTAHNPTVCLPPHTHVSQETPASLGCRCLPERGVKHTPASYKIIGERERGAETKVTPYT